MTESTWQERAKIKINVGDVWAKKWFHGESHHTIVGVHQGCVYTYPSIAGSDPWIGQLGFRKWACDPTVRQFGPEDYATTQKIPCTFVVKSESNYLTAGGRWTADLAFVGHFNSPGAAAEALWSVQDPYRRTGCKIRSAASELPKDLWA